MRKLLILLITSLAFSTVTDIDGNVYETVVIGDQLWMAENLKVTHYNNGEDIPTGLNSESTGDWPNTIEGAYAIYYDEQSNLEIYGNLYNWYAIDDERGVCPDGWHVPSDEEWTILMDYLGGALIAGLKMKDVLNWDGTNESGFTALPSGMIHPNNYGSSEYLNVAIA